MLTALGGVIVRNLHLCALAATALGAALVPALIDRRDADDWTTIAFVQQFLIEGGNVSDPFFGTSHVIDPRYLLSVWPRLLANLSNISTIGPVSLVREWLPPVLVLIGVLAAFSFYSGLTRRDRWFPAIATVLLVLYFASTAASAFERQGESFFFRLAQDKFLVAFILVPFAVAMLMRLLASGSLLAAAGGTIVAVVAANVHPIAPVLLAILTIPLIVAHLFDAQVPDRFRRGLIVLFVIAIAAVPAAMHLWLSHSIQSSVFFSISSLDPPTGAGATSGQAYAVLTASRRYDTLPFGLAVANHGFAVNGMAALAGALVPFVALRWKTQLAARYSILLLASIIALLYVPPLTRVAIALLTPFQAWRVSFLLPFAVAPMVALGLPELHRVLRPRLPHAAVWLVTAGLLLAAIVPGLVLSVRWQASEGSPSLYLAPTDSEIEIIKRIDSRADNGQRETVLATRWTSRFIPSYAPHARVVDFRDAALAFPADAEPGWEQRRSDAVRFFEQVEVNDYINDVLLRYDVDLVVVERTLPLHDMLLSCPELTPVVDWSVDHTLFSVEKSVVQAQTAVCRREVNP